MSLTAIHRLTLAATAAACAALPVAAASAASAASVTSAVPPQLVGSHIQAPANTSGVPGLNGGSGEVDPALPGPGAAAGALPVSDPGSLLGGVTGGS